MSVSAPGHHAMPGHEACACSQHAAGPEAMDDVLRSAFASDLQLLAVLNDREPSAELIESLRATPARNWFAFKATGTLGESARALLDSALDAMPAPVDVATLDDLAADFAAIYLIHSYRAPPTESPWLDKDQLERQEPMFQIAAWYRRHGLAAQNRQLRSDDHLVLQLQFLAHVMSAGNLDAVQSAHETARFLDEHLLRWIGSFAERVATRCATPYYCGLVTMTHAYLVGMRDDLADRFAIPRPQPTPPELVTAADVGISDAEPAPYIPGVAPSW